ncbi:tellurite resistance TerB family protein [Marmoricola endophyticus]|uniref:tellurite resistance TerB family protein n=1 Tax=Marmoricola endophyticus TaxID=2040280 RepID=UPI0016646DA0|nr:TerB N-terminal domain-containing protein [Marmoricola endophyticus]
MQQLTRTVQWIGPGTTATIGKYTVPGGMLYVGHGLQAPRGGTDPALIDPRLSVSRAPANLSNAQMGYWPAYDEISPTARAGYLTWLASGRRDPRADIGFVFLFLYGLERRALVDIPANRRLGVELAPMRAELQRLLDVYGENYSFRSYASKFLDVLDVLGEVAEVEGDSAAAAPPLDLERRWEAPLRLRVGLGAMASDGKPIPADWALAWAWYHPEIHLRTPATRCREEFTALFNSRYGDAFGEGIRVRPGKTQIKVEYYTATSGMGAAQLSMGVPDVFTMAAPRNHLAKLVESVTADLDAYSRYLGRNPEGKASLAAAALLPVDLAGDPSPQVADLVDWAAGLADSGSATTGAEVLSRWPAKSAERLAKAEAVTFATLLARYGLGMEPDVRLGGPAITTVSKVVTFRTGTEPQPQASTAAYAGAATLLHLATAVAAADGHVSAEEQRHLVNHLERALDLTPGERVRLGAHMRWLAATGVKLTGLVKRVEVLTEPQRSSVADLLVAVAAADGVISSEEIASLTKIFTLLGVDPAQVHTRLHALLAGGRPSPATSPVVVREATGADPGYPISPPPPPPLDPADVDGPAVFQLDARVIEAKFAETAAVGALLADIFGDDEPATTGNQPPPEQVAGVDASGETLVAATGTSAPVPGAAADGGDETTRVAASSYEGLDAAHSAFLQALLGETTWSRADIEELAESNHLMPDGAIDIINEYALEITGDTLLDENDTDTFTINDFAREELPT